MARTRTLIGLISDVRMRTNQENSTFVTDAEITEYLNQAIAELQVRLAINEGQPHFRSTQSYTVTSSTASQALPATFWALQEVTATLDGVTWALSPFMAHERASLLSASNLWPVHPSIQYRIQGANIEFRPAASYTADIYFHPSQTRLISGESWDGFNGYEMAAIYDTCAQVMAKEESDPSFFLQQRDRIYALITQAAQHRDMSSPERVTDVTASDPLGWLG